VIRTSNGIIERLLGEVAGLVGRVENLVVEDREVQGKTKANRMRGSKVGLSDLSSGFVGLQGGVCGVLALVADSELGEVAMVITLPVIAYSSTILQHNQALSPS